MYTSPLHTSLPKKSRNISKSTQATIINSSCYMLSSIISSQNSANSNSLCMHAQSQSIINKSSKHASFFPCRTIVLATPVYSHSQSHSIYLSPLYMTVHGMQQQLQSSVLMQLHLPPCGLTMEPAVEAMELVVEAGIVFLSRGFRYVRRISQRVRVGVARG